MFVVHFFEDRNELLNQLLGRVPSEGEDVVIKGRKGKVSSVASMDDTHVHVHLFFEKPVQNKNKLVVDNKKKKR